MRTPEEEEARADQIRREFAKSAPKTSPDEADVRRLLDAKGLDAWETSFAHSLGDQVIVQGRDLTTKQRATLDRILGIAK